MLWLIACLLYKNNISDNYKIDELAIGRLNGFAIVQNKILLQYLGKTPGSFKLFLYDLNIKEGNFIVDGRIKLFRAWVIPLKDGFGLVNRASKSSPILYEISLEGKFIKQQAFSSFENWKSSDLLTEIFPKDEKSLIINHEDTSTPNQYKVSLLHIDTKSITLLYTANHPLKMTEFVTFFNGSFLKINRSTAQIDMLDPKSFQKLRTLHAALPTVENKSILPIFVSGPKSAYYRLLFCEHLNGQQLQFEFSDYFDDHGKELDEPVVKIMLLDKNFQIKIGTELMLYEDKSKKLQLSYPDFEAILEMK